jgi:hypothetical protein
MGIFSFSFFLFTYLTNYIIGMTTGHLPTEEITRNRKRPKKTSINFTIAKEAFNREYRTLLKISLFIDCYNHYMNSVDVIN